MFFWPKFLSVTAVALLAPAVALAYVDPGSGSLVLQGIIAAIVGAGVGVKVFWKRIKRLLTGRRAGDDGPDA